MHHHKICMYINFQQNLACRSVKTVHTNLLEKNSNCINLQLSVRILKKSRLSDMHYPQTDIQADFEINRPIRYHVTAIKTFTQTTDGQTHRRRVQ